MDEEEEEEEDEQPVNDVVMEADAIINCRRKWSCLSICPMLAVGFLLF